LQLFSFIEIRKKTEMLKKLVCQHKILFLFFSILLGIITTSNAATITVPTGFKVENQFVLPTGIPTPLGDVVFSADGNTLYILGASESADSGVWSVPVTRDPVSRRVISLGSATLFFSFSPNPGSIDTSLEFHPSGNGTLFFRTNDVDPVTFMPVAGGGDIGQRTSDGTITLFRPNDSTKSWGGLAFMPSELSALNGIDLLVGDWYRGITDGYSLTDNGDGIFTPVLIEGAIHYSNSGVDSVTGDQHFVPSGDFANDMMFADSEGTIGIIDIDPNTGFPVTGAIIPFASGFAGPWGLEFDPITNDLFVSNWGGEPSNGITQISGFPAPVPEPIKSINIDIKPRHCPNRFNMRSNGKLRVAILGTEDFDVRGIDVDSVRVNNLVAPFKPSEAKFKDVTCPSALKLPDCEVLDPDTYEDLVLKFNSQDIIATLGIVQDGDIIELTLTGNLLEDAGGTAIEGKDCVLIEDKGDDNSSDDGSGHKKKKKKGRHGDDDSSGHKKKWKKKRHHGDDDSSGH
jgi:hypothetical protein